MPDTENNWRERRTLQDCMWNGYAQYLKKYPCEACVFEWLSLECSRILMIQTDMMSLLDEVGELRRVKDLSPLHEAIAEIIDIHLPYRYFPALDLDGSIKKMKGGRTKADIKRLAQEIIAIKLADTFQACIKACRDELVGQQLPDRHCLCWLILELLECDFGYNAISILLGNDGEEYTRTVLARQCRNQERHIFRNCYKQFLRN